MYRDHAEYLREWIEFHRLVGVDRFFLYNNESSDDHREVLAPYIEQGVVVVHEWPTPASVERGVPWNLIGAFDDCLAKHRDDSRWITFIDIDEFLFSPDGTQLRELLHGYEDYSGVSVTRLDFGSSGHETQPAGLVIESYLHRRSYGDGELEWTKSILDPKRTVRCENAHVFDHIDGWGVDVNKDPVPRPPPGPIPVHLEPLRINHYLTKSEEEYRRKLDRWQAAGWPNEPGPGWMEVLTAEFDDAIVRYVPALREVLAQLR